MQCNSNKNWWSCAINSNNSVQLFYSIGILFIISACLLPWNFKFSWALALQYYYCGGNDGTVCAGFVLGTFSKNSKVLLWFYVLSSVAGTWLALTRTSGAACLLVLVGTFWGGLILPSLVHSTRGSAGLAGGGLHLSLHKSTVQIVTPTSRSTICPAFWGKTVLFEN